MGQGKHGGGTGHGQGSSSSSTQSAQNAQSWKSKKRGSWKDKGQKPSSGSVSGR